MALVVDRLYKDRSVNCLWTRDYRLEQIAWHGSLPQIPTSGVPTAFPASNVQRKDFHLHERGITTTPDGYGVESRSDGVDRVWPDNTAANTAAALRRKPGR